MDDDLKEMEAMPDFKPDVAQIDPRTMSKLDEDARLMAMAFYEVNCAISVIKKQNHWLAEQLQMAYNRGVKHTKLIQRTKRSVFGLPAKIVYFVASTGGAAAIVKLIDLALTTTHKKP